MNIITQHVFTIGKNILNENPIGLIQRICVVMPHRENSGERANKIRRSLSMKVRVFDKTQNIYFKSIVFARINTGWYEKQLVLVPSNDEGFIKFFDFLDKSDVKNHPVLINTIVSDSPTEWICQRSGDVNEQLNEYIGLLDNSILFFEFIGYPWILENKDVMIELLKGKSIPYKNSIFENKVKTFDIAGWNYIETQEDAESFMEQTSGFHDSVLKELSYISGAYVNSNRSMHPIDNIRKINITIVSQICQQIEMVFEGVTALNLRPAGDNKTSDIFGASVFVKDESVFFCDDSIDQIDLSYEGTWIIAYGLRWRFIS
jgi:hypothetical protein